MEKLDFCIHGHFYQPPREDPLTGEIPVEPGAAPYRNWNERISAQCYRPNAQLGNFQHISFNIGPTLLEWMERYDSDTLRMIIQQERENLVKNGAGNAIAQAYNHTILPLANLNDKITQVRWGITDFEHHFGHKPEGMWLPEAAVDDESMQVLVDCGIKFTILAPWQADTEDLDASQPYRVDLPGNRHITVFFYNQDLSTRVSFDPGATVNADRFISENLLPKFNPHSGNHHNSQLVVIASDGELYGHHQPFRDKFLAYLHDGALSPTPLHSVYPALWLKMHQVERAVKIRQKSSWSCHHGVTRWMGACGCTANNAWKEPLRQAMDCLAERIDEQYLAVLQPVIDDPWELRHRYIEIVLGRIILPDLLAEFTSRKFNSAEMTRINLLLRAQFERQRMFTSCGWFFEDLDRIEPRNNIAYAAQAVWLAEKATGEDLAEEAGYLLSKAQSWRTPLRADEVFRKHLIRAEKVWRGMSVQA